VARRKGIVVEEGTFEAWDAMRRRFDLLISGQAWHWVDPHLGAAKAGDVLVAGGRIGLFWNQAFPAAEARHAMAEAYRIHAPVLGENSVLIGQRDDALYGAIADAARGSGRFVSIEVESYEHEALYSTEQWLELASTHSDHRTLPPETLHHLLEALHRQIDAIGGRVAVRYETTLVTGRTVVG
jgi:SAM-dependent methyltransferase